MKKKMYFWRNRQVKNYGVLLALVIAVFFTFLIVISKSTIIEDFQEQEKLKGPDPTTLFRIDPVNIQMNKLNPCKDSAQVILLSGNIGYGYRAYPGIYQLISFNLDNPGSLNNIGISNSSNFLSGGTWVDGKCWSCEYAESSNSNIWVIDYNKSGMMTLVGASGSSEGLNGLAYDDYTNKMYACSSRNLYTIDMVTGEANLVGTFGGNITMIGIAFDSLENLYGECIATDSLYSIDKSTGKAKLIGSFGGGIDLHYAQDMAIDKESDTCYLAAFTVHESNEGALYRCNLSTGLATKIGNFGESLTEITCLAIPYVKNILYVDDDSECPGNGSKEWPYCKIQYAIDNASFGDIVYVYNGVYDENIIIDKTVDLIGENRIKTVIDGNYNGNVVDILNDRVSLKNFTITNSKIDANFSGIKISSSNNIIHYNLIVNNWKGINLDGETYRNNVYSNSILKNYDGISVFYSNNNDISANNISNNRNGLILKGSKYNSVSWNNFISNNRSGLFLRTLSNYNIIHNNSFSNCGINVDNSYFNIVKDNKINGKSLVFLEEEHNKIIDYDVGQVILIDCDHIIVKNQNLSNTTVAIQLINSDNCQISNNNIIKNNIGIHLTNTKMYREHQSNNVISGNTITDNEWFGIYSFSASNNNILGNSIINNDNHGIWLDSSTHNKLIKNNCSSNGIDGIGLLYDTSHNYIANNTCSNNLKGIAVLQSINNTLKNNTCDHNLQGIMLNTVDQSNIIHNNFFNNKMGIYLYKSNNNNIINNNYNNASYEGIALVKSNDNNIINNSIKDSYHGIVLSESNSNDITNNNIYQNSGMGIILQKTKGNKINYNNIYNNTDRGLGGVNCLDNARFNWWGYYRPRFIKILPLKGDVIQFIGWVRIFPWLPNRV
jgi:parallel beta-helix repeat protein